LKNKKLITKVFYLHRYSTALITLLLSLIDLHFYQLRVIIRHVYILSGLNSVILTFLFPIFDGLSL